MAFLLYKTGTYARHIPRELRVTSIFPVGKGGRRVSRRPNQMPQIVNWGCGLRAVRELGFDPAQLINGNIGVPVSKLRTFKALAEAKIPVPPFSEKWEELSPRGKYLARRDYLSGGAGIQVVEKGSRPPQGEYHFYSLVVSKAWEMRVHVFMGAVICEQFKFVPAGSHVLIRNYDNGARFSNKSLEHHLPKELASNVRDIAIRAVAAAGVQFGAVDMMVSQKGAAYVLEVNTAPGLSAREDDGPPSFDQPSTYDAYLTAFRNYLQGV